MRERTRVPADGVCTDLVHGVRITGDGVYVAGSPVCISLPLFLSASTYGIYIYIYTYI